MGLDGKRVIVTGAARGMGRAMVDAFVAEGATVVATDLPGSALDELSGTDGVAVVAGDLTDPATLDGLIQAAEGRVDVLNNVAGLLDGLAPIDEIDEAGWSRVIAVNLTAPFLLCQRVIPLMIAQGGGVITNTASIGGMRGGRAGAAYTASKHGLVGLTQNIAVTHGHHDIRANALCPGATYTAMTDGQTLSPAGLERFVAPRPRMAKPEQQASVAVFLASDAASHINGAVLPVDYGQTAI